MRTEYSKKTIYPGDNFSDVVKTACIAANKKYSLIHRKWLINENGKVVNPTNTDIISTSLEVQTDWVWTKIEIYQNQFETYFQQRERDEITTEELEELTSELFYRMIMDLVAMNADDLREGELAILLNDILEINFLIWPKPEEDDRRGKIFTKAMAKALSRAIEQTQIAITWGESAITGEAPKYTRLANRAKTDREQIKNLLNGEVSENEITKALLEILKEQEKFDNNLKEEINIHSLGGCVLGLKFNTNTEKLVPLKEWQVIIWLQEMPKDGIVGPRSNGLTRIRNSMKEIMGEGWENKTFENFIEKLWSKQSSIPDDVMQSCKWKKLRDIATGVTTVFNPFVAGDLLWGLHGEPKAKISKLIHVTGNPTKKIAGWLDTDQYVVNMDISTMPKPQIITLLQIALGISDEDAMSSRNMWIPYVIICDKEDIETIIQEAKKQWITAECVWYVQKKSAENPQNIIKGVGIGNSSMPF